MHVQVVDAPQERIREGVLQETALGRGVRHRLIAAAGWL